MIKIEDLLTFIKQGWVAMDEDGEWRWFAKKPLLEKDDWLGEYCWVPGGKGWSEYVWLTSVFDIAPYDGDWKDSLMECGK